MEFTEVVRRRRMVRSFTDEPVAPGVVERILDTARRGPSAGYSQGVEFVVVTDAAVRRAVAPDDGMLATSGHPNFVAQAPVHVIVCTSPEIYRARYREPDKMRVAAGWSDEELWEVPYWYTDAGAALMLMLLAAVEENVAAAFVGCDADRLRELLGIPPDYVPVGIVLLGHAAPDARKYGDVSADPRKRRPLTDVVHYGRWAARSR
ncbi:MAG TPA: nitroreductase family protein [Actinophytocola sp.]|jgi:nitroreductase|nr:nitroreductase family protein [Actinophytocola sp.]